MKTISTKKNYFFTLGSNFMGTVISTILGIISVPISLNYWKVERYGIWALITSMLIYLNMTNLGLNYAVTVLIAKNPNVHDKLKIVRRALKIMVFTIAAGLTAFILINVFDKEWVLILGKIPAYLKEQTLYACIILGFFYLINIPFSLISSLFVGFQKAYLDNIFNTIGYIGNFCSLLLVIAFKGNLMFFAMFYGIFLLLVNISKFLYFYFAIYRKLDLNIDISSHSEEKDEIKARSILITGLRFFFIGIASMVVWNTDNFVISNFLGIQNVTPYSITFKLYNILFTFICMVNGSIMPIMGKEFGVNNWEWINRTYNSFLVLITVIGGLTWLGGLAFFKDVITLWTGSKGYAGLLCVFALGGYSYLLSMVNLNSNVVNTFNYTKKVAFLGWFEASIKITFSIILLHFWGLGGVAVGTFLGSLFAPAIIFPRLLRKRSENRIIFDTGFVLKHFSFLLLPLLVIGILTQLFVSNIFIRLVIGLIEVMIYLGCSFVLIPNKVKPHLKHNLRVILVKLGVKNANIESDAFTPNKITTV